MNREIKFRAYTEKYGMIQVCSMDFHSQSILYWDKNSTDEDLVGLGAWVNIDFKDCELMQYIGTKDKNNIDIYEGDIARYIDTEEVIKLIGFIPETIGEIYYDETSASFDLASGRLNLLYNHEQLEVLGNIFENGELLND